MLVVEFSWTSFEVEMGFDCTILRHGSWVITKEKVSKNNHLDFLIITNARSDAQENAMFYPPKDTFGQSNSLGKWAKCSCDPLDGNNSTIKHLHWFSCQNVQITMASHIAFGVRKCLARCLQMFWLWMDELGGVKTWDKSCIHQNGFLGKFGVHSLGWVSM